MKTISIFNEKGGVGKSALSEMFASWLAYHEGARVCLFDFEAHARVIDRRESELKAMGDPKSILSRFLAKEPVGFKPYLVESVSLNFDLEGLAENSISALYDYICLRFTEIEDLYDYIVVDFPSGMERRSPSFVIGCSGLIDLVAIPFDTNSDTRKAAYLSANLFRDNNCPCVLFWNNVSVEDLRRERLLAYGEKVYNDAGFEVLPQRIKTFVKAGRDSDSNLFVRSTVCWPERYVQLNCPELPKLFAELKSRLDAIQF